MFNSSCNSLGLHTGVPDWEISIEINASYANTIKLALPISTHMDATIAAMPGST